MKARYSAFLVNKEKLGKVLNNRQEEIDEEMERKRFEAKQEQQREEERRLTDNNSDSQSFFNRDTSDYERLYDLDVLGVRDRGEDDELDVYTEFKENIVRKNDGRYEVNIPWIPGAELAGTNEEQSRRRLQNMNMKRRQKEHLSVTVTKDQAGSADRGRPITSKFSAFFLYHIRLRSVVFLVK